MSADRAEIAHLHIILCCALLALSLALLPACSIRRETTAQPVDRIADAVIASQSLLPELHKLSMGEAEFSAYVDRYYQFPQLRCTEGVILYAAGADACEIALFRFADAPSAAAAREALEAYLNRRLRDFDGYIPEQGAIVKQGRTDVHGTLAALLILPDSDSGARALSAAVGASEADTDAPEATKAPEATVIPTPEPTEAPLPTPEASVSPAPSDAPEPEIEETPDDVQPQPASTAIPDDAAEDLDVYHADAVLFAWRTGDASRLRGKNAAILEAAQNVLSEIIVDSMTPYEKELAIHDWMIANAQFDYYNVSHHPDDVPGPDNEDPYGFFYLGKGVCCGYASTFQLLMDMVGVNCRSVKGLAGSEQADHVWNMVELDDEWYFVDVSWDDPLTSNPITVQRAHRYFNVTGEYLKSERHTWDESAVPEACGTKYAWK